MKRRKSYVTDLEVEAYVSNPPKTRPTKAQLATAADLLEKSTTFVKSGLEAGDEIQCLHCRQWHVVEHTKNAHNIAVDAVKEMLYVFCPKQLYTYYVGSVGKPSRWPMRKKR